MARIRTIKPSFWNNEDLSELKFEERLLFIGLWNFSDSEGRLEDRPKRIRADIFPYDPFSPQDMDIMLSSLHDAGFITRYKSGNLSLIQINTFEKHQRLTGKEATQKSSFPAPNSGETTGKQRGNNGETTNASQYFTFLGQGKTLEKSNIRDENLECVYPPNNISLHPYVAVNQCSYAGETTGKQRGNNGEAPGSTGKEYIILPLRDNKGLRENKGNRKIREKNNTSTEKSNSKKKSIVLSPEQVAEQKAEFAWNESKCQFSDEFKSKWIQMAKVPKWRIKAEITFVLALKKLMEYEELFATMLVEATTVNNWQGVIFHDTPEKYENWKHNKNFRNNGQRNQRQQQGSASNTSNDLGGTSFESAFAKISYLHSITGNGGQGGPDAGKDASGG